MDSTNQPPHAVTVPNRAQGAPEVDETLLAWTLSLSPFDRLDASYRAGLALDKVRALSNAR
jgi:hypothetical protein